MKIRDGLTPAEWTRAGAMAVTVIGLNVLGWGMVAAAAGRHIHITHKDVYGFGTGILAYTLGMRHAFDADHIAAIDNTTRKLVGEGKRPLSVGFFFSLGHSSVVFVLGAQCASAMGLPAMVKVSPKMKPVYGSPIMATSGLTRWGFGSVST